MFEKKLMDALLRLNLTHKEAEAYVCLAIKGVLTAEEVSKLINVQYPIVYRTLEALKSKNWIDSTAERPKKYRAIHPSIAAKKAGESLIAEIEDAEQTVRHLLQPQFNENQEMMKKEMWVIRGMEGVCTRIRELASKTRESVVGKITGPIDDKTFNRLFLHFNSEIPITVQVVGPPVVHIDPKLREHLNIVHPYFEKQDGTLNPIVNEIARSKEEFLRRTHSSRFVSVQLLFDNKEVLWINIPYRDNKVVTDKVWANWSVDPEYIEIMKTGF
jgi:sugar-specific transcriptional regulator TrmB